MLDALEVMGVCFSALVVGLLLFQQSNVSEGEVASFALTLTLPLAVHVDLGHFYCVAHLQSERCLVVGVGHPLLNGSRIDGPVL